MLINKVKKLYSTMINGQDHQNDATYQSTSEFFACHETFCHQEPDPEPIYGEDYPAYSSDEYKKIDLNVRKAIRTLLKEGHPYDPQKLMSRQEIIYALGDYSFPENSVRQMILPWNTLRGFISDEYKKRKAWSLEEAASLSVGMDPFMYEFEAGQFNPDWRERRQNNLIAIKDAIALGELRSFSSNNIEYVDPVTFCIWSDKAGILKSELTKPLKDIAKSQSQKTPAILTTGVMKARFYNYAEQQLFEEAISKAERRKRELFTLAIWLKNENPKLKREEIAKIIWDGLSEDCKELKGYKYSTLRKDLRNLDNSLDTSVSGIAKPFLNAIATDYELESTDPTHRWWNQWAPILDKELPWMELPDDFKNVINKSENEI